MFSAPWRAWAEGWGLSQSPPATELISPSARSLVKHLQKGAQRTSGLETCVCGGVPWGAPGAPPPTRLPCASLPSVSQLSFRRNQRQERVSQSSVIPPSKLLDLRTGLWEPLTFNRLVRGTGAQHLQGVSRRGAQGLCPDSVSQC